MAKISVKSKYSGGLESPHDSWKEWIIEWIPDEFDFLMERYDPDKGNQNIALSRVCTDGGAECVSAAPKRLQTRSTPVPAMIRTPIVGFRRPAPPAPDPFAARRAAARASFQRQVAASRAHVSDILSKLGNAK